MVTIENERYLQTLTRKFSPEVAPTTLTSLQPTVNFRLAITYLQLPI